MGAGYTAPMSALWILFSLAAFSMLHSALASPGAKALARQWLGQRTADGIYRLLYNVIGTLTVVPPLILAVPLPGGAPVWHLPPPPFSRPPSRRGRPACGALTCHASSASGNSSGYGQVKLSRVTRPSCART